MIKVTNLARQQLSQLMKNEKTTLALFYVKGGGCNGFKYCIEPVYNSTKNSYDEDIHITPEHTLRICGKSMMYLIGTEIDFQRKFMDQGFTFNNPNITATCGCGMTFTPQ